MTKRQIFIGFMSEGPTDARFLESIIQRTFEEIAFECHGTIDILPVQRISITKSTFIEEVKSAARQANETGLIVLCVYTDADAETDVNAFEYKIHPAFTAIQNQLTTECPILVAIVPIQMTEAWMLGDTTTLRQELGTDMTDHELRLLRPPESVANPKKLLEDVILLTQQHLTRRHRYHIVISELYTPIGQKIILEKLATLTSYRKFKEAVRAAYRQLNLLA